MSGETNKDDNNNPANNADGEAGDPNVGKEGGGAQNADPAGNQDSDALTKMVAEKVEAELAEIKSKLNNAYATRDEAIAKLAEKEQAEEESRLEKLREEGKHKEAFDLELTKERAKNDALLKRNTELSRDNVVRESLRGLDFRNEKAADVAFKEVISELSQNENGEWVHKTGVSVSEFVQAFSKDEVQSFLFKPKTSTGAGSQQGNGNPPADKNSTSL
ncbi:MAG: hypothetical protein OEX12_14880, partial [Gammaproteobacteria bacterium]|nr:hypothetical protein [Gammaproteobacteria bacterium]